MLICTPGIHVFVIFKALSALTWDGNVSRFLYLDAKDVLSFTGMHDASMLVIKVDSLCGDRLVK